MLEAKWIILIIIASLILCAGVYVIFYFAFIRKRKLRKQIKEINKKHTYLNALLVSKDTQYVKRLAQISSQNRDFLDIHTRYLLRLKELREKRDITISKEIDTLFSMFDDSIFKDVKNEFVKVKNDFDLYEKDVLKLDQELKNIFVREDNIKTKISELKDSIELIKQEFYSKQIDLKIVSSTFEAIFNKINQEFKNFHAYIEVANYSKIEDALPEVENISKELKNMLRTLSPICALADRTVPENINQLKDKYFEMTKNGYPLQHLIKKDSIENLEESLKNIIKDMRMFKIKHSTEKLNNIISKIKDYEKGFEKEIENRKIFEKDYNLIYKKENYLEKDFIKLCNSLPNIKKVYVISQPYEFKKEQIQKSINKLALTKRSFDTLIHSAVKQPFSILVSKMNELNEESKSIEIDLADYNKYIGSLKTKSEEAYKLVYDFYFKLRKAENLINEINIENFTNQYKPILDELLKNLDEINKTLNILPIDVEKVDTYVNRIKENGESIIKKIEEQYVTMKKTEVAIVYANRERQNLSDINTLIVQCEKLYFDGKFDKAYADTSNLILRQQSDNTNARRKNKQ